MNHYAVKFFTNKGEEHKITVMAYSIRDALELFNDTSWLFDAREIISVEPEKTS